MAEHGLDMDWYCHRHRTEDEVLPWDHLSAGLHKDFLWQDWRDALDELGLEDCRWTPCYDCGACTGYGIEHVVASAVPPAGGSQGTGQGLAFGGARGALGPQARGRWGREGPRPLRQARQDPLPLPPGPGPHLGAQPAPGRASPSPTPRGSRPGRLHFGLALSTGHESLGEYLDIDLAADADVGIEGLADRVNPYLPAGMVATAAAPVVPGTDSLQQAVTSSSWELEVVGPDRALAASRIALALAASALPIVVERKGNAVELDARPAILALDLAPASAMAPTPTSPPSEQRGAPRGAGHATPQPPTGRAGPGPRPHLGRGKGAANPPMDAGRRRPPRADPPP